MIDYELYPIRKQDVDWPLYLTVGCFVSLHDNVETLDPEIERMLKTVDNQDSDDTSFGYQLVFPAEEYTLHYDQKLFEYDAAILKLYFDEYIPVDPYDEDGDFTIERKPMEYYYCQKSSDGYTLHHYHSQETSNFPIIPYNGDDLLKALDKVINLLEVHRLTDLEWYDRLLTTHRMLHYDANELHILHNAGLYDNKSLWQLLISKGVNGAEVEKKANIYMLQLKKYAMHVLNRYNWSYGVPVEDENKKKNKGEIFAMDWDAYQSRSRDEIARRKNMPKNLKADPLVACQAEDPQTNRQPSPETNSLSESEADALRRKQAVEDFKKQTEECQKYWGQLSIYHWPNLPPSPKEYKGNPFLKTLLVLLIVAIIVALVIGLDIYFK